MPNLSQRCFRCVLSFLSSDVYFFSIPSLLSSGTSADVSGRLGTLGTLAVVLAVLAYSADVVAW